MSIQYIRKIIAKNLNPKGKTSFLSRFCSESKLRLLDVGCGNNSDLKIMSILREIRYTGLDIAITQNQRCREAGKTQFVETTPKCFHQTIEDIKGKFDIIISSHNLEHCNERTKTLRAMLSKLNPNGEIYLSFPCQNSVNLPSRVGTLNYYDDATHKGAPPCFQTVIDDLKANNYEIIFSSESYKPNILYLLGFLLEPISRYKNKALLGTWAYYGFETIIWAKKLK